MSDQYSKKFIFPSVLGSLGFLTILISEFIVLLHGSKIVQVTWIASGLVLASTIVIRFYSIDLDFFHKIIRETNPLKNKTLHSSRFLNWIVIAIAIGRHFAG
ncbi:MAG: hypothetical protein ACFFB2_17540 [Promethearchaeota archaeon]